MSEPREAIAAALTGYLTEEQATKLIDEVLSIEKRVSAEFTCKNCGQRQMQWGTAIDAKAVASALVDLSNQSFGRPQEASAHQDPIQFYRLTNINEAKELQKPKKKKKT